VKTTGTVAVGTIAGPYQYRTDLGDDLQHVRPVKWIATDVPRDSFDQDLLYSFGAFLTFGRVRRENAAARILAVIQGTAPPPTSPSVTEAETAEAAPDIRALAAEQIRQFVSQQFAGHDLATLIGHLLRASSFTQVLVSPPGADLGVDILAGSGPMGLDSPRLAVQVKTGQAGVDEFRALKGVMEHFRADQGLLVAWRGFKGTVRNESRSSFFSVRLWDANDVLDALLGVYELLPDDVRSQLPLQRTWSLVPPEEA
jgi:restriction system protein